MRHRWPCTRGQTVVKRENELASKEVDEFSSKPSQQLKSCDIGSFGSCVLFWMQPKQSIHKRGDESNYFDLARALVHSEGISSDVVGICICTSDELFILASA